jgi:myo-inositol 2-dehydrogenase / D-chiro-inositol 1-dehydrogenase
MTEDPTMLRLGILGCGRIGKVHAKAAARNPKCRVVAVSDPENEAAVALAEQLGVRALPIADAISTKEVDAVIVCSPTDSHVDYIEAAAWAGKVILCEKPISLSAERIVACLDRIAPTGVPLMVGFNRRFDPSFAHLLRQLRDGTIGSVESVAIISRDPAPPTLDYVRSSGGLFRDMMIHDFDLARLLLGEEPVEVYAVGSSLFDEGVGKEGYVDTAAALLKTTRGAICQISCLRRASYGFDQRVEAHGSKGALRAANIHLTLVERADESGFHTDPLLHFFLDRYADSYERELDISSTPSGRACHPLPAARTGYRLSGSQTPRRSLRGRANPSGWMRNVICSKLPSPSEGALLR